MTHKHCDFKNIFTLLYVQLVETCNTRRLAILLANDLGNFKQILQPFSWYMCLMVVLMIIDGSPQQMHERAKFCSAYLSLFNLVAFPFICFLSGHIYCDLQFLWWIHFVWVVGKLTIIVGTTCFENVCGYCYLSFMTINIDGHYCTIVII